MGKPKVFMSGEIKALMEDVKEHLEDGHIYVVTGEYGAGKTTALGALEAMFKKDRHFVTLRIEPYERLSLWGLVRWVMKSLGRKPRQTVQDLAAQFREVLADLHKQGKRLVLIIDNGQLLSSKAWLVLKILTTDLRYEGRDISAFAIVGGNIDSADIPEEARLRTDFFRMQGLDEHDVVKYIRFKASDLPQEAVREIAQYSNIPIELDRKIREIRRQIRRYGKLAVRG